MYPCDDSNGNSYLADNLLLYTEEEPPPPSSLFYNFPSPSIHYEDDIVLRQHLHDLFLQHPPESAEASAQKMTDLVNTYSNAKCRSINEPIPAKKSPKKDRHSKIETAQGPRDRRMRLSLEVAPQFFGLQDMLGFDKASKTMGWLLSKSENAIKDLKKGKPHLAKNASSNSESEEVSGIDESSDLQEKNNKKEKGLISVAKEKKIRPFRESAFDLLAKESREKARIRARKRTIEKKSRINEPKFPNSDVIHHEMHPLGSWNAFENGEEFCGQSHINPSRESEDPTSSINIFDYDQHSTAISQEDQFADYEVYGKTWETYNNFNPF